MFRWRGSDLYPRVKSADADIFVENIFGELLECWCLTKELVCVALGRNLLCEYPHRDIDMMMTMTTS